MATTAPAIARPALASLTSLATALWRDPQFAVLRTRSAYVARTLSAVAIALWLAAWLQLRNPQSAVTTVLIVANPAVGALVSKSVWRIVGTVLGAVVAVAVFAAFGQAQWLFFTAMAVWVGLCCFASTLLRYFKAYGAVLSGYTLVLIAAPAYADPDRVLLSALSRLSVVVIGIVIAGAVFLLTTRQPRAAPLLARVRRLAADAAGLLDLAATVPADTVAWRARLIAGRQALTASLAGIDEQLEFLPAANPRLAVTLTRLRLSCARVLGMVSGIAPIARLAAWLAPFASIPEADRSLAARIEQTALDRMRAALAVVADPAADAAAAHAALGAARLEMERLGAEFAAGVQPGGSDDDPVRAAEMASELRGLAMLDLIGLMLGRIEDVLDTLAAAAAPASAPPGQRLRLRGFNDWRTALRNGVRGALATLLCCGIWYVTEWPEGPSLLAYVVPAAGLLATAPSAGRAARDFAIGTIIASMASVLATDVLLPQAVAYWQIWLVLCLLTAPMIWLQLDVRYARIATAYMIFFSAQLGIQNPLHLDIEASINTAVAFIVGSIAVVMVFSVLLPPNDLREARRLTRTLLRSVERCARPAGWWSRLRDHGYNRGAIWEHWHMQVISRLIQRSASLPDRLRGDLVDGAMSSVILGRAILRLHDLADDMPIAARPAVEAVLADLRHLSRDPAARARRARAASAAMPLWVQAESDETTETTENGDATGAGARSPSPHRVAATLRQIGDALAAYPAFYDRCGPLQGLFTEPGRLRVAHMLPAERVA